LAVPSLKPPGMSRALLVNLNGWACFVEINEVVQVQSTRSIYQSTSWARLSRALIIYLSRRFRSLGAGLLSNLFQILGFWSAVRQFKDSRSQEGLPCRRVYMINGSRLGV
jgi:hypothetical protein